MTNRREFLQATAIVATVPVIGRAAFGRGASGEGVFVFDERLPGSRRFGVRADAAGWPVRAIDGDVTSLWSNELARRWSVRPVPVFGLTARPALFCLERLAWDHRMRVIHHVEHRMQPNGETTHVVGITQDGVEVAEMAAASERWPEFMADALAGMSVGDRRAYGPSQASMPARFGDDRSILHSWVIAPVLSAARASH